MNDLLNQTEQRAVQLGRLASGLLKSNLVPTLEQAYKAARLILLDAGDNVGITKRNQVTAAIRRAIAEIDNDGWAEVTKELEQIAIYDAGYYAGLVGSAVSIKLNTPADEKITSYINKAIMSLTSGQKIDAGTWADFVKAGVNTHADLVDSIVKNGYSNGQTVQQMIKQLRDLTDGLVKNQAEALVRTGIQHYANNGREAMLIDNDVDEVVYTSVLDNRTTILCMSRDGNRYSLSDPKRPALPAHWNCRSTYIPAIAMQDVDTRAAVGGKEGKEAEKAYLTKKETLDQRRDQRAEDRADGISTPETPSKVRYRGKKDSNAFKAGQIKYTQYDEWLKRQPAWFQDSALGKGKAEIFRQGKLSLAQFVDLAGRPLTLAELRALDGNT